MQYCYVYKFVLAGILNQALNEMFLKLQSILETLHNKHQARILQNHQIIFELLITQKWEIVVLAIGA